jgi:glycosyltransferase involved in cell wall biosynthesis
LNKKLHILFLSGWYPSKEFPTNGDFIQRHAEALSTKHQMSVVHIVSTKNNSILGIDKKKTNSLNTYLGYVKYTDNQFLKFFRFIKMFYKIKKEIGSYDLIHLNILYPFGIIALIQKVLKSKPYIISEHWTGYHKPQIDTISSIEKHLSKIIAKKATFLCPVSNHLAISMRSFGLNGKYKSIPNVVDTSLFIPKESKHNHFNIIHISSLKDDHKNITGMLNAAKLLEVTIPNFTWTFIGGNGKEYQKTIQELDFSSAKIEFIDHLEHPKMISYLQQANLFVLFSNYENLPCVILESFSCGVPVISTNVGGIEEYFPQEFGMFVPKNDAKVLAEKICYIYQNPIKKQEEMHRYARRHFSKEYIANQYSNIYYKTLNN